MTAESTGDTIAKVEREMTGRSSADRELRRRPKHLRCSVDKAFTGA